MVKTILAVLVGMLLQVGLTGLRAAWQAVEPAAQQLREAVSVAGAPPAARVAAEPEPPAPWLEKRGLFAFPLDGCGPVGVVGGAAVLAGAAEALGMTPEALRAELEAGRTLAEVAETQGVARETLVDALREAAVAAYRQRLDEAVAAGRLTQAQADERLERFEAQDFSTWLDGPFFMPLPHVEVAPFGGDWPFGMAPDVFGSHPDGFHFSFRFDTDGEAFVFSFGSDSEGFREAAAGALGLTPDELAARLDAGESLAEIAEAQVVALEAVEEAVRAALLAEARERLDAAVAEGSLTQDEADRILDELEGGIRLELFRDPRHLPWPPFFENEDWPGWLDDVRPDAGTD